jgi:hypothetical protein
MDLTIYEYLSHLKAAGFKYPQICSASTGMKPGTQPGPIG